jgi:hypothetical protein
MPLKLVISTKSSVWVLQAMPVPSWTQTNPQTSPKKPPLKLSYSQVIKTNPNLWAHDPGKYQVIKSPDPSHDLSVSQISHDQSARDHGKPLDNLPRDWSSIWSPGRVNFRSVMHPLINTWKTVGVINKGNTTNRVIRLTMVQSAAVILPHFDHLCTINLPALKGSPPVTHIRACPKAAHRSPCISI